VGLKCNGTHQVTEYVDTVKFSGDRINITKENAEALTDASKEIGPGVKREIS
jgi:hypothetical protein